MFVVDHIHVWRNEFPSFGYTRICNIPGYHGVGSLTDIEGNIDSKNYKKY